MIVLKDGRIMWVWGHNKVWANYSSDGGRTWSDAVACTYNNRDQIPGGVVSLIRLASGDLGMTQAIDDYGDTRRFSFHLSKNEGRTWSDPVYINLSDRPDSPTKGLIQLNTGRLALPCFVTLGPTPTDPDPNVTYRFGRRFYNCWSYNLFFCCCYYSDDEGLNWQHNKNLESLDNTSKLEPEPLASWLLGAGSGHYQPLDRVRYHHAPGPLRNDH